VSVVGGRNLAAQARGRFGEGEAARWYVRRGFTVLDRNWRCDLGEIDLVVCRPGLVVVVEVKARRNDDFGGPLHAISRAKQLRLRRLAARWLAEHRDDLDAQLGVRYELRLDLAAVTGVTVEVFEGVL
jgi:putative endonuclease